MILLVPSKHGILTGFCALISIACAYGEYRECNAFGRYINCACYRCKGEYHKIVEIDEGRTIHCCSDYINNFPTANILEIVVDNWDNYTEGFESSFKNAVVDSLLYFCQDEQHQDRCGGFEVNSLVAGDLHVMNIGLQNSYKSVWLYIRFVVFATEKSSGQSTGRKRRLSLYSATNETASKDKVKRHAVCSQIKTPLQLK